MKIPAINGQPNAIRYTASFGSSTNLAAATASIVVAPAANPNGLFLWAASMFTFAASANRLSLLAKASAPASLVDGDLLLQANSFGSTTVFPGVLACPMFVSAGKGLYLFSDLLETNGPLKLMHWTAL